MTAFWRDRLRRQEQVLVELAKSRAAERGDLSAALQELTEAAADVLEIERVGIWLYTEDRSGIRCIELFERTPRRHSAGGELAAADAPAYFKALEQERTLAAADARADERTREFAVSYLEPLDIYSMLDAPLRAHGRMIGVICHEHVGSTRRWTAGDQSFAASMADLAALALEAGERHKAERELRERVAELQILMSVLQESEERSRLANEAKDRFLATLSHELRTPLTPVLAMASMLERDERLPGDVRSALTMMRRNVELEARLIDDLLDLTRISRGKLELERGAADVRQVLEHALDTVEAELMTKRLRLVTDMEAEAHHLLGDAPRLTQVFWNLLHNAIKFTPEGGTITVRSRIEGAAPGKAGELLVEVADSGIGIEPQVLPRIFNAFEQADRLITRRFGGLGLGLAVSRAIVELHGGTLTATSMGPGQGSTFCVRLPLGELQAVAEAPKEVGAERPSTAAEVCHALHLLLVEDHADTAAAMADLLEGLGYRVTVAGSVAEALAAAAAAENSESGVDHLDLLVSDLGLPDGSGLDVMRELAGRWGLRGIALSGYGMEEDLRKSREAGFEKHLTKPVNIQTLAATIRQVAEEGRRGGEAVRI